MIFEAETRKRVLGRERERREPDSFSSTSNKSCRSLKRPPAFSATNFSHFIPLFCLFLTLTSASPNGLYSVVGQQNIKCLSCAYAAWGALGRGLGKGCFWAEEVGPPRPFQHLGTLCCLSLLGSQFSLVWLAMACGDTQNGGDDQGVGKR
jgi:hypothetical protein